MKNFISGAIKKSRTSLSILVLLGLSGVFALNYLPKATEPDVNFPGAFVGVFYEGVWKPPRRLCLNGQIPPQGLGERLRLQ